MAVKVMDENGVGTFYNVLQAYDYIYKAQQLGTNVVAINLSLGGYLEADDSSLSETCELLKGMFDEIGENGAVSVIASGNEYLEVDENGYCTVDSVNYVEIPVGIDSDYIITVGAITESGEIANFSNYGSGVDIAAPGTNILSTTVDNSENNYFNPNLLSDSETQDLYISEYNFNDGVMDLNYSTYYITSDYTSEVEATIGTITTTDENYFGTSGKSLKWTFTYTNEELESGLIPSIIFATEAYTQNSSTNIAIYLEGTSENFSAQLSYAYSKDESTEVETVTMEMDNFNYWMNVSTNWFQYDMDLNFNGMNAILMNITEPGTYTVYIDDIYVTRSLTEEDYDTVLMPYTYEMGTSMAAPHVAAAIAIASNLNENMTALELKEKILANVSKSETLTGKVTTGILNISNLSSTVEPTEPENPEEPSDTQETITSNKYTVSNSGLYITDVPVDTTIEEFKEYITTELNYELKDKDGNTLESTNKVATGYKLVTEEGEEYLIAVLGDVTGDGIFDISDVSVVASHVVDKYTIEGIYLKAADVVNNDSIDISDLAKLASALVGNASL